MQASSAPQKASTTCHTHGSLERRMAPSSPTSATTSRAEGWAAATQSTTVPVPSTTVTTTTALRFNHVWVVTPIPGTNVSASAGAFVDFENAMVTTAPVANREAVGSGFEAFANTTTGQHSTAPASLPSPFVHREHCDADAAATTGLNVPASHRRQSASVAVPFAALYRPAGHGSLGPPEQ